MIGKGFCLTDSLNLDKITVMPTSDFPMSGQTVTVMNIVDMEILSAIKNFSKSIKTNFKQGIECYETDKTCDNLVSDFVKYSLKLATCNTKEKDKKSIDTEKFRVQFNRLELVYLHVFPKVGKRPTGLSFLPV
jgi:hypothetical protein